MQCESEMVVRWVLTVRLPVKIVEETQPNCYKKIPVKPAISLVRTTDGLLKLQFFLFNLKRHGRVVISLLVGLHVIFRQQNG